MRAYQACRSSLGWQIVPIQSSSSEYLTYNVYVCPWQSPYENICQCPGYTYNGKCKHQLLAMDKLCGWTEIEPSLDYITQDDEQREAMICPRCGGPTKWELTVD